MDAAEEREAMRRWVENWKTLGPELEAIRLKEIAEADNRKVLESLESAFNCALRALPPRETSGLVEMQRLLARLRT